MEQFEVAGISQTHDEMVRKIEETTAVNEARMDMAMSNVDQQKIKIDDEAEKLQASELVKQFKIEMGVASPQATAPSSAEKTIAAKEQQRNS
jgi:phage shock protein A